MPHADLVRCRLTLVTPADFEPASFVRRLGDALSGGDVASLIIRAPAPELQAAAEALVPVAQARGVAVLVHNDTRIAGRARADGVHIDSGHADLTAAVEALRPKRIVGAGGLITRHDAMRAGEADPDYLFFGRLDGDGGPDIFPKALDLADWWSSVFVIPAMVMGGSETRSVTAAAEAGVEFVALCRAVWEHPGGPAAAVAEANGYLAAAGAAV